MSGYVYRGSGVDTLTPDDFAPLPDVRCPGGRHLAFATTDRDGVWFWACRCCPAVREQGTPTWL